MNSVKIAIHSYVDLITNSSTEIYVSSSEKTVAAIRKIVDTLLSAGGNARTADELFDFALVVEDPDSWPTKMYPVDSPEGKKIIEENESEYSPKLYAQITAKVDTPELKAVANTLSNLRSLFGIEARYNG